MILYPLLLFLHIAAVVGLFMGLSIEPVSLTRMRQVRRALGGGGASVLLWRAQPEGKEVGEMWVFLMVSRFAITDTFLIPLCIGERYEKNSISVVKRCRKSLQRRKCYVPLSLECSMAVRKGAAGKHPGSA